MEKNLNNRIAIIGAGELGHQIRHYAEVEGKWLPVGWFDDFANCDSIIDGLPVLGKISDIEQLYSEDRFDALIIGIGYKHLQFRSELYARFKGKIPFVSVIASPGYIDSTAEIEEGCMIYPGCIIDKGVVIEPNSLLNLRVVVSHDSHIGGSSFLAPGVLLAGFSEIGRECFIGAGAMVRDSVKVTDRCVVGIGSVVVKDIVESGVYVGNPARKLR